MLCVCKKQAQDYEGAVDALENAFRFDHEIEDNVPSSLIERHVQLMKLSEDTTPSLTAILRKVHPSLSLQQLGKILEEEVSILQDLLPPDSPKLIHLLDEILDQVYISKEFHLQRIT
jgi:hypothetical protein